MPIATAHRDDWRVTDGVVRDDDVESRPSVNGSGRLASTVRMSTARRGPAPPRSSPACHAPVLRSCPRR